MFFSIEFLNIDEFFDFFIIIIQILKIIYQL